MRKEHQQLPKLIVLLGPTASGKTKWSLDLAKKFNGEIISADSRQIYKKMDIGTAKTKGEWKRDGIKKYYIVDDIPHYLIDFVNPGKKFTAADFHDQAIKYIKQINRKGKVPFVVGGTGLYIQALIDNWKIPRVAANNKLRQSFEEKDNSTLIKLLEKIDPEAAKTIDTNNKRRIIRALEVSIMSGEKFSEQRKKGEPIFDILQIGIETPREKLYKRINKRVDGMIKKGLIDEIKLLLKLKYSWQLPSMSGIGYRQFREYLEHKETLEEAVEKLKRESRRFAKRQMTWFKRDKRINWCTDQRQAQKLISEFLQK